MGPQPVTELPRPHRGKGDGASPYGTVMKIKWQTPCAQRTTRSQDTTHRYGCGSQLALAAEDGDCVQGTGLLPAALGGDLS